MMVGRLCDKQAVTDNLNIRLRKEQLQLPESLVMIWTKELNEAF
jgi:hypothetical protein